MGRVTAPHTQLAQCERYFLAVEHRMNTSAKKRKNVDAFIAARPQDIAEKLQQIRRIIMTTCPEAVESISYGMPAYKLNGKPLVYFSAFPHHIGVYATPTVHELFAKQLASYKQGKGSVQFPNDKPFPLELVQEMIAYKMKHMQK